MKTISILFFIALFASISCEQLAEEETPVCKMCYSKTFSDETSLMISSQDSAKLCGGDVLAWQEFEDLHVDSTTTKYYCDN